MQLRSKPKLSVTQAVNGEEASDWKETLLAEIDKMFKGTLIAEKIDRYS